MAIRKFLSLSKLQEYHTLIKEDITKSNTVTLASAQSHSNANLTTAQTYTDNAVAQKSQVQIVTWEDDD